MRTNLNLLTLCHVCILSPLICIHNKYNFCCLTLFGIDWSYEHSMVMNVWQTMFYFYLCINVHGCILRRMTFLFMLVLHPHLNHLIIKLSRYVPFATDQFIGIYTGINVRKTIPLEVKIYPKRYSTICKAGFKF